MSNRLKQITTKAKALYKTGKFAKWTDAIKAASKQTGTAKKKIGAVKKKAAPKKKSSYHKDTKSHNVNIKVVSGVKDIERLKQAIKSKENLEQTLKTVKTSIPKYRTDFDKKLLKVLPQLIKQEKIIINALKKSMK